MHFCFAINIHGTETVVLNFVSGPVSLLKFALYFELPCDTIV